MVGVMKIQKRINRLSHHKLCQDIKHYVALLNIHSPPSVKHDIQFPIFINLISIMKDSGYYALLPFCRLLQYNPF